MKYIGDPHIYHRYKESDHHFYIDCTATSTDVDGTVKICSYSHKREDRHKEKLKKGTVHECQFINKPSTVSISDYFHKTVEVNKEEQFNKEALLYRLSLFLAQKNISTDTGASEEMYEFITYCIAYGVFISHQDESPFVQAKAALPRFKNTKLSQTLIDSAKKVHIMIVNEFKKADFVAIAIDEGKVFGSCHVDFNLENPLFGLKPYPFRSEQIDNQTWEGYVTVLLNGLAPIKLAGISIGSVVCDGNKAQKKAFSFEIRATLRFQVGYEWLKEVIFIPCLCHLTHNAYKNCVKKSPTLVPIMSTIREGAKTLRNHREEVGALCPPFINTRWIYDYDILDFMRKHIEKCQPIFNIPPESEQIYDVISIFKSLVGIFEKEGTKFWRAFYYIEKALKALDELTEKENPYADAFKTSLFNYTLGSKDGGLWVLGYLFTREGHDDFYQRIHHHRMEYQGPGLEYFQHVPSEEPDDPIQEIIQEATENAFIQQENENDEELDITEEEVADPAYSNYIESAKTQLQFYMKNNMSLSDVSTQIILRRFNTFCDDIDPFPQYQTDDFIGYSWNQIGLSHPDYKPISVLALKLLNSAVSEASCERTISAQRMIYTAKRRHSNKTTLDARLRIMSAGAIAQK